VPESLYYFAGELYPTIASLRRTDAKRSAGHPVTVSSERLTNDDRWTEVPPGQIIILRRDRPPQFVDARTGAARTAPAAHQAA
jgi:hypothetical protein